MKALEDQFTITISIGPDPLGQALSLGAPKDRVTKSEANYGPADPHSESSDDMEECGNCLNFHPVDLANEDSNGHCDQVSGMINEDYVCDLYEGD